MDERAVILIGALITSVSAVVIAILNALFTRGKTKSSAVKDISGAASEISDSSINLVRSYEERLAKVEADLEICEKRLDNCSDA